MNKTNFGFAAASLTLALFGGAATMVGCGGPSTSSLCSDFCACERCTSNDLQGCEDAAQAASDQAEADGCSAEFDAVIACALEKVTCEGDGAVVAGCDAEKAALKKCPSDVDPSQKSDCEKAGDQVLARLEVCGVSGVVTTKPTSCPAAQGTLSLCTAACIDGASCGFLKCSVGNDMAACSTLTPEDSKAFSDCSSSCSAANSN